MIDFTLYLITDRHQVSKQYAIGSKQVLPPPCSLLPTVIEEALKAGIKAVQLREKDLSAKELFELAQRIQVLAKQYGAKLFINDRVDIALSVEADGVHLGQKSFSAHDIKSLLKNASHIPHRTSQFLVGVSTHSLSEAKKAEEEGADFITLGPLFATPSKAGYGEPLGSAIIKRVKKEVDIPIFAIGGINKNNVKEVMNAGAHGVAVISAIMGAEEPEKAAREILEKVSSRQ